MSSLEEKNIYKLGTLLSMNFKNALPGNDFG